MSKDKYTRSDEESQWELAAICIKRFYCGMAPEYKKGRLMVALQAFMDDSGDESTFALGGFIAPIEIWDKLSVDWTAICKESPSIRYYKTHDAISRRESFASFAKWDIGIRNQKVAKLASVIPFEKCYGIGAHLPVKELKEIKDHYPIKAPFPYNFPYHDPYFICAICVVAWICINFESLFPEIVKGANEIDFIFDKQGKVERQFKIFFDDFMQSRPPYLPRLGECEHRDDQKFPPLQAADMCASWIRRGASSRISMWTSADIYLRNIEMKILEIDRGLFNKLMGLSINLKQRRVI